MQHAVKFIKKNINFQKKNSVRYNFSVYVGAAYNKMCKSI